MDQLVDHQRINYNASVVFFCALVDCYTPLLSKTVYFSVLFCYFLRDESGIWRKTLKIGPGVWGLHKPPSRVLSILRPILNEISCLYFCSWHIGKTLWFWILYIKFSCQYYIKVNKNFYTIYFKNQNTFTLNKHFMQVSMFLICVSL